MKNYWVEHNSIEISKFDKDFKKHDGTRESLEEIIKSHPECSDNQDKYNTLEEALKKASMPYCREMEGNAYRYLLIEYDTIWEEDTEEDTFDSLGVYGIDIEK